MLHVPLDEARQLGAMALFGEKYGEEVRVITFDPGYSIELCGGTHVPATGQIGFFKIVSEGAIAAGIRRIEAVTGERAEAFVYEQLDALEEIKTQVKNPKDPIKGVKNLVDENKALQKQIDTLNRFRLESLKTELAGKAEFFNGTAFIGQHLDLDLQQAKDLAFALGEEAGSRFILFITQTEGKINLSLMLSADLVKEKGMHAGNLVKDLAREINGGGGGQPHFATAGGSNPKGIETVLEKARQIAAKL
jgi:alanyl-tRNA synthetase